MTVRTPAVAGSFYPADPVALEALLARCWAARVPTAAPPPKAIIAPHAGYVYSGPVAASAYATLEILRNKIRRVVLLGPSHRFAFAGMALPEAETWRTPLGDVPIDTQAVLQLAKLPGVTRLDRLHEEEHSLEVHLPFLQRTLGNFQLVPIVCGRCDLEQGARVLEEIWGGPETLIVASTDLSHYHDSRTAKQLDAQTTRIFEHMQPEAALESEACGSVPVAILLQVAQKKQMRIQTLDTRTSGDTAGGTDRVVGYGAWLLWEKSQELPGHRFTPEQRALLGQLAWNALEPGKLVTVPDEPWLQQLTATFVTLEKHGQLRGCIGSLVAHQPLGKSVIDNARNAAFQDPRFNPVELGEIPQLTLHLSILSPPQPLAVSSHAELEQKLRPEIDGVIVTAPGKSATFLPDVWKQLPDPKEFLAHLWQKAGLQPGTWPPGISLQTYTTENWDCPRAS